MPATDTRNLQLQISASAELLVRNLKQADNAVADFQQKTDGRLASIDARFAALGALKGKLAGLDSHVGLGGIASAATGVTLVELARRGLDYASSLGEVAQQLGVTTRGLQELRYAGSQVGISNEEIETGLGKLTAALGQARLGAEGPTKALKALGVSLTEVKGQSADQILPQLADGLKRVGDAAARAAIERELFGKAGQKFDTLLAGGAEDLNNLANAAADLGLVLSDDQIQNADRTADKMAELKQVLEANIANAVANNAAAIYDFVNALERLISKIPDAIRGIADFQDRFHKAQSTLAAYADIGFGRQDLAQLNFQEAAKAQARIDARHRAAVGQAGAAAGASIGGSLFPRRGPAGDLPQLLAPKGAKGPSAASLAARAAAAAKRDRADQRRADDAFNRAQSDVLSARADLNNDPEERLQIERQRIDLAKAGRDRDLEEQALDNRYIAANLGRLKSLNAQNAELDKQLLAQRRAQETEQAEYDRTRAAQDDQIALLEIGSRLAVIARDRHAIEQRILAAKQEEERQALQRVVDNRSGRYTPDEVLTARQSLDRLPTRQAAERQELGQQQRGPLAQYRDQLLAATGDMNEALEGVKVHALQSVEEGLLGLVDGTETVASAFKKMASSIIADLARIAIEKAIVGALGGSSGIFGSLFGGARATGGPVSGSKYYLVGEHGPELFAPGASGSIIPNGALKTPVLPSLSGAGAGAGVGGLTTLRVHLSDDLHATIDNRAAGMAVEVVRGAAPALVDGATTATIARLRQPSL